MTYRVIFNLQRHWVMPDGAIVDLYEEIKSGRKTSEYRYNLKKGFDGFWFKRLCRPLTRREMSQLPLGLASADSCAINMTYFLKVCRTWFVVGYPKNCLPRLEADITKLLLYPREGEAHLEIQFNNVREVIT